MIKLLKKDWILLRWNLLLICFVPLLMSLITHYINTKSVLLSVSISSAIFLLMIHKAENSNKEPICVVSLPMNRSKIVFARYASVFIFAIVSTLLYLISSTLINFLDVVTKLRPFTIEMLFFTLVDIIIFESIVLPFYFNDSKSIAFTLLRFSVIGSLFMYFLTSTSSKSYSKISGFIGISRFSGGVSLYIYLLLLLILPLSYFLSVWLYKRREF